MHLQRSLSLMPALLSGCVPTLSHGPLGVHLSRRMPASQLQPHPTTQQTGPTHKLDSYAGSNAAFELAWGESNVVADRLGLPWDASSRPTGCWHTAMARLCCSSTLTPSLPQHTSYVRSSVPTELPGCCRRCSIWPCMVYCSCWLRLRMLATSHADLMTVQQAGSLPQTAAHAWHCVVHRAGVHSCCCPVHSSSCRWATWPMPHLYTTLCMHGYHTCIHLAVQQQQTNTAELWYPVLLLEPPNLVVPAADVWQVPA